MQPVQQHPQPPQPPQGPTNHQQQPQQQPKQQQKQQQTQAQPQQQQRNCNGDEHEHHSLSQAFQTYLRHDKEEQSHWEDVCQAYRQYATFALCSWANQRHRLDRMPESLRKHLPNGLKGNTHEAAQRAKLYKDAAIRNQFCLDCILRHAGMPHSQQVGPTTTSVVGDGQISKVSSVLKSLARDWSSEGKAEREMAYQPLLENIQQYIPMPDENMTEEAPKICVPGAGVGRLALEIGAMGYRVQGNEFSLFMLLASDFILNSGTCSPERPFCISPWLLETRNVHGPLDPMRTVSIPDVDPSIVLLAGGEPDPDSPPDFSMAAGDFVSIYGNPREANQWDAVVCCFFLDAAPNIVEYVQVIHQMLKDEGMLINFGPLLYHWSGPAMRPDDKTIYDYENRYKHLDKRYMTSVDISWTDVKEILKSVGFRILEEHLGIRSLYTADRRSMMNMEYRSVNFVAQKIKNDNNSV